MMNTATNSEFYERQSIEEFLGEHEVVRELYEALRASFSVSISEKKILRIFNFAYYICMRLTDGSHCSLDRACIEVENIWPGLYRICRTYVLILVRNLLFLNNRLVSFDEEMYRSLVALMDRINYDDSYFRSVRSKYRGGLTQPINFSGLSHKAPVVQREELTDPMQLLERAASDIAKAGERMKEQLAEKDKRIKELADQVKEEQAKVQVKEARIKELEERNASLSSNPFCLDKIKAYAKGLDKDEAKVITHMLLTIALEEQLPKARQAEVREAVKEVEAAHRKQVGGQSVYIEHQEIHNDNKDSQVFNGSITDSNFGK